MSRPDRSPRALQAALDLKGGFQDATGTDAKLNAPQFASSSAT